MADNGAEFGIGNDLVVITVHHQDGDRDLLEIVGEVGLREGLDAVVVRLGAAHHGLPPPVLDDTGDRFHARPVEAIEGTGREIEIELCTVFGERFAQAVEHLDRDAARVGRRLHHNRRHRAHQDRLRDPAFAVSSQIVGDLAAPGGMADVDRVLQVEMRGQRRQVIGIVIHVVTLAHLRGPAMTAAVMRDDAIAVLEEKHHLGVPVIGRKRPAVAEHDGLTFAPVLVENLNAVFGRNRTHW